MSCHTSNSCESDAEPVTRLKDIGRPKPPKRPASRHVVNPNFMFFCQIVLLVIPITVLYAGLYFMNISSPIIILICGAIIFLVLCIFVFVRPFKEEKYEEKKPLRQSYEYSPIKIKTGAGHHREEHPKREKRRGRQDDENSEEDVEECPPQIKAPSTDTLLSITSSDLVATKTSAENVTAGMVTSPNGRCEFCQNCSRSIPRANDGLSRDIPLQAEQSLPTAGRSRDGYTLGSKPYLDRTEQFSTQNSLGLIEEEGDSSRLSQKYSTSKLLVPDDVLSDCTNASVPTTDQTSPNLPKNTPCSENRQHLNPRQASNRRTIPCGTIDDSSSMTDVRRVKTPPGSPRKPNSPQHFERVTFSKHEHPNKNAHSYSESFRSATGQSTDVPCASRVCMFESKSRKEELSELSGLPPSIASAPQTHPSPKYHSEDTSQLLETPQKDEVPKAVCPSKLCPLAVKNQPRTKMDSGIPAAADKSLRPPQKTSSEKPTTPKRKRGYLEENTNEVEKLTVHGKQNIFLPEPQKEERSIKSVKGPESQTMKFALRPNEVATKKYQCCPTKKCQCSSLDPNKTKEPIVIKLFPTSSKDGVFSWDPNPAKSSPSPCSLKQNRTVDGSIQTSSVAMVDTQTSAVVSTKEKSVHYSIPEVTDRKATQGKSMHQTTSGSMVDFVLRPFSKAGEPKAGNDKKSKIDGTKSGKRSKHKHKPRGMTTTNDDSSKFDLLKIQSPNKTEGDKKLGENQPKSPNNKEVSALKEKAKLDICTIFYSGVQNKLYQPTRSGLLVTESSKEDVPYRADWPKEKTEAAEKYTAKSPRHHQRHKFNADPTTQSEQLKSEGRRVVTRIKRKSDDEGKRKPKCARHDELNEGKSKGFGFGTSLPWQKDVGDIEHVNSALKHPKLTCMFPPYNLDFSSGPCDGDSKASLSNLKRSQQPDCLTPTKLPADDRISKKPQSPGQHGTKSKNHRISHQVETTLFRKSSSSYDNVVIEKVTKQKKRTLKKFK